jgi:hypothetical protein
MIPTFSSERTNCTKGTQRRAHPVKVLIMECGPQGCQHVETEVEYQQKDEYLDADDDMCECYIATLCEEEAMEHL